MEQLGRYILERKLAMGGMAEVFLARQVGPGGFEKACVVKRMLSHLSEDVTFVEMFLDEARVAAQLAHPGIAQIFDFGHERDTYYLAMEYVQGANLKMILEANLLAKRSISLPVAARIASLVANALEYAHHATDDKNRPLQLIHRDVSPQNVMVSINGDVKLIDFGIAKATTDSHRTVAGTLKGKYAYMSPEQLRQQKVDQRTDIYALGLVLYELLAGKPAVAPSDNVNALMVAAAQRRYAPLELMRPETPKRLKQVLDKALALAPVDRFQHARELADQLEDWLASTGTRVKPADLAILATDPGVVTTEGVRPAPPGLKAVKRNEESISLRIDEDVPPTVVPRQVAEARTLQDLPKPQRETIASKREMVDLDKTPLMGTDAVERIDRATVDVSSLPTPIVGTPPVGRRSSSSPFEAVQATSVDHDASLVPTMPERSGAEVEAVIAIARKNLGKPAPPMASPQPNAENLKLEAVTEPKREVPKPAVTAMVPPPTGVQPVVDSTGVMMAKAFPQRRYRRWPWVLMILLLLPIGTVAALIEFLPSDSPLRTSLLQKVAPLLQRVEQLRK